MSEVVIVLLAGGAPGSLQDKIYVSSETEVRGFSKKGKQFLSFDTNLTEPIQSMCVEGSNLMVCGSYIYNHYVDCKDTNYYLSSDKINDLLCLPPAKDKEAKDKEAKDKEAKDKELFPILACQDCTLRVLKVCP